MNVKIKFIFCYIIFALSMISVGGTLYAGRVTLHNHEDFYYENIDYEGGKYIRFDQKKVRIDNIKEISPNLTDEKEDISYSKDIFFPKDSLLETGRRLKDEYPHEDGIVILDNGHFRLRKNGKRSYRYHFAGKILKKDQVDWSSERVMIQREREKFKLLGARTISPEGKVSYLNMDEYKVTSPKGDKYPAYNYRERVVFSLPEVRTGSIVEYIYKVETYNPYNPKIYFPGYYFQWYEPVAVSQAKLTVPANQEVTYRAKNFPSKEGEPVKESSDSLRTYTWRLEEVPPLIHEHNMPGYGDLVPHLRISLFEDYTYISSWLGRLQKRNMNPTERIKRTVEAITEDITDIEKKVARLYYFVQQSIRYLRTGSDIASFRGHPAEVTLNQEYGNSADKALLFSAMLKEIGVKSYPIIINTNDQASVDRSLPTLEGNHVMNVLYIDGERKFLDCSSLAYPYPYFRKKDYGVSYFNPIKNKVGTVYTPTSEQNYEKRTLNLKVDSTGSLSGVYKSIPHGPKEGVFRTFWAMRKKQKWKTIFKDQFANFFPRAEITKFELHHFTEMDSQFTEYAKFTCDDCLSRAKNYWILSLPLIYQTYKSWLISQESRRYNIEYRIPRATIHKFDIELPKEWKILSLPSQLHLENRFGEYTYSLKKEGNHLLFEDNFEIKERVIPSEEYELFSSFLRKISSHSLKNIYIQK